MEDTYKFIKGYQKNNDMRKSFNDLAQTTFFEAMEGEYLRIPTLAHT